MSTILHTDFGVTDERHRASAIDCSLTAKLGIRTETWRTRPLRDDYPYMYLGAVPLWNGRGVIMTAIGVSQSGSCEIIAVEHFAQEDEESWCACLVGLRRRGLTGLRLCIADARPGLVGALELVFPNARWQRCIALFNHRVLGLVPTRKVQAVSSALRDIHQQRSQAGARRQAGLLVDSLRELKLADSAKLLATGIEDGLTYYRFPQEHWSRLRTSNPINRLLRQLHAKAGIKFASVDHNAELVRIGSWLRDIATRSRLARFPNMQGSLAIMMQGPENAESSAAAMT